MRVNIVIFLNCDQLQLEIRDSYKKPYCNYISFHMIMFWKTAMK